MLAKRRCFCTPRSWSQMVPRFSCYDRLTADHHGQPVASQVHLMIRIFLISNYINLISINLVNFNDLNYPYHICLPIDSYFHFIKAVVKWDIFLTTQFYCILIDSNLTRRQICMYYYGQRWPICRGMRVQLTDRYCFHSN